MKVETKTVFSCDHCKRAMFSKGHMTRHENNCTHNPANWDACIDCAHIKVGEKVIEVWNGPDEPDYRKTCKSFTCSLLNQEMYPFKAAKKKLPERFPEDFEGQKRMPTKCEHYKAEWNNYDNPF